MRQLFTIFLISFYACTSNSNYPVGGYDYPSSVVGKDTNFFKYPIKELLSRKDSFRASYDYISYGLFDEPNLSIKPMSTETFRFTYSSAFGESLIITIVDTLLVIKEGNVSEAYERDLSKFTPQEKLHLDLLNLRYPIDTLGKPPPLKRFLDSMIVLYPQLLDVNYYVSLYEKSLLVKKEDFKYKVSKVSLSKNQYSSLVNEIRSSGFWGLPYNIKSDCDMMDGYGFSLEANTKAKYQMVSVQGCPDDTTKFTKACQSIIKYARMDKRINLVWEGKVDSVSVSD